MSGGRVSRKTRSTKNFGVDRQYIAPMGSIRRTGVRYCGDCCGHGCTFEEYERACKGAAGLTKRLGNGWMPLVWENLGWFYAAVSVGGNMKVHAYEGSLDETCTDYQAFFGSSGPGGRWVAHGNTPEEAIRAVVQQACEEAHTIGAWLDMFRRDTGTTLLRSTRSCEGEDARRDFDRFNPDEELRRMRAAIRESADAKATTGDRRDAMRLAVEVAMNLDEWLTRAGRLPKVWESSHLPHVPGLPKALLSARPKKLSRRRQRAKGSR